jgi:hypothetical protein
MRTHSLFEVIRERVPLLEAIRRYSGEPVFQKRNLILCPIHGEKTASFNIKDNKFYCFGCGAKGDVVDFVRYFLRISPKEAVERIKADFGVDAQTKFNKRDYIKRKQREERERKRERFWTDRARHNLRVIDNALNILRPQKPITERYRYSKLADAYLLYEKKRLFVEWVLDVLAEVKNREMQAEDLIYTNKTELLNALTRGELRFEF